MAEIPAGLPPDVAADTVWTKSQVNRIYAYCSAKVDPPRYLDAVSTAIESGVETAAQQGTGTYSLRFAVGLTADTSTDTLVVDEGSAGIYLVGAQFEDQDAAQWPTIANDGLRYVRIQKNASTANELEYRCSASTANVSIFTVSGLMELAVGDTLRWRVYQSSSNAAGYQGVLCIMWAHWIGNIPA